MFSTFHVLEIICTTLINPLLLCHPSSFTSILTLHLKRMKINVVISVRNLNTIQGIFLIYSCISKLQRCQTRKLLYRMHVDLQKVFFFQHTFGNMMGKREQKCLIDTTDHTDLGILPLFKSYY